MSGLRLPRILQRGLLPVTQLNLAGLPADLTRVERSLEAQPRRGTFVANAFENAAGQRDYKLFIPSGSVRSLPLIVMLHGCTQTPDDFAAGTRMNALAEERKCFVLYPAQALRANPSRCWNWFNTADQERGTGEPSILAGMTQSIAHTYAVDPRRIFVAGLSAGAAAAAVLGATYPDVFAGLGIHSGLPCGSARNVPSALAAMRNGGVTGVGHASALVRTIVFHGDRDNTVHPRNGAEIIAHASHALAPLRQAGRVPGGHAYTRTVYADSRGRTMLEHWVVHASGHAWSGGSSAGSFTDPLGPDASSEMLRFFLDDA